MAHRLNRRWEESFAQQLLSRSNFGQSRLDYFEQVRGIEWFK